MIYTVFLWYIWSFVDTYDYLKVKETHDRAFKYMYLHIWGKYFDSKMTRNDIKSHIIAKTFFLIIK